MNKLIKNLVEQARKNEPVECSITREQWLETFAGLIVAECIKVCDQPKNSKYELPSDKIREHFGVVV